MSPEALALFEIAQSLIGVGRDLCNGADYQSKLERVQAHLDVTIQRLGLGRIEEQATRNTVGVLLMIIKQDAARAGHKATTMAELNTIKVLESAITKSVNDWLASRQK